MFTKAGYEHKDEGNLQSIIDRMLINNEGRCDFSDSETSQPLLALMVQYENKEEYGREKVIAAIAKSPYLTVFNIAGQNWGASSVNIFFYAFLSCWQGQEARKQYNLKILDLEKSRITSTKGFNRTFLERTATGTGSGQSDHEKLDAILEFKESDMRPKEKSPLKILNLTGNQLVEESGLDIGRVVMSCVHLIELRIDNNALGDLGLNYLVSCLSRDSGLKIFSAEKTNITDQSALNIAGVIENCLQLSELNIADNRFTAVGLRNLRAVFENLSGPVLSKVDISNCGLDERAMIGLINGLATRNSPGFVLLELVTHRQKTYTSAPVRNPHNPRTLHAPRVLSSQNDFRNASGLAVQRALHGYYHAYFTYFHGEILRRIQNEISNMPTDVALIIVSYLETQLNAEPIMVGSSPYQSYFPKSAFIPVQKKSRFGEKSHVLPRSDQSSSNPSSSSASFPALNVGRQAQQPYVPEAKAFNSEPLPNLSGRPSSRTSTASSSSSSSLSNSGSLPSIRPSGPH